MSSKSTTPPEPTLLDVPPSKTLEEADDVPSAPSSQPKRPASMSRSHSITASIKDQWDKHLGGEVGERPDWMSAFTLLGEVILLSAAISLSQAPLALGTPVRAERSSPESV